MKKLIELLLYFLVCLIIAIVIVLCCGNPAFSEEELSEAWVLCQPDSFINVREFPKKTAERTGYLMSGDRIFIDGTQKGGYMRVYGITEAGEGWVHKGFLVYSEPVPDGHVHPIDAKGRVACRRYVDGTRRCWVYDEDPVTVYMISDEWCLTNKGFIKTEFIDLTTRLDISEPTDPEDMTWEEETYG